MKKVYYNRKKREGEEVAVYLSYNAPDVAEDLFYLIGRGLFPDLPAPFVTGFIGAMKSFQQTRDLVTLDRIAFVQDVLLSARTDLRKLGVTE